MEITPFIQCRSIWQVLSFEALNSLTLIPLTKCLQYDIINTTAPKRALPSIECVDYEREGFSDHFPTEIKHN